MERTTGYMRFLPHIEGWTSEQLIDADRVLSELVEHPGWEVLTELVEAERQKLLRAMTNQTYQHVEYASQGGRISGLDQFADVPEAVRLKAQAAQREIEQLQAAEAAREA